MHHPDDDRRRAYDDEAREAAASLAEQHAREERAEGEAWDCLVRAFDHWGGTPGILRRVADLDELRARQAREQAAEAARLAAGGAPEEPF